jgi:choline dehydrogenase
MLGGGSSLNAQVYIRGVRADFDEWASLGATGWSFNDVFPYFLRSEHWHGQPSQAHGSSGPLSVSPIRDPHPLCATFLDACRQIGLPTLEEYNDGADFGAFMTQASQRDGWRCSTEKAYLRPARGRPNLQVITGAEVDRVRVSGGRAVGVTVVRDGRSEDIDARREVLVCAGAMGSPALLMRSGIGPAADLRRSGVEVVRDAPGVGQNLQEHSACSTSRFVNISTLNNETRPLDIARHFAKFFWNRSGPLSAAAIQAMAFAKTETGLVRPDVQLHFMPAVLGNGGDQSLTMVMGMPRCSAVSINVSLCKPKGRGRIILDERRRPRVVHQALRDPQDVATLIAGLKMVDRLFETPALAAVVTGRFAPRKLPQADDEWLAYLRENLQITWHAAGTCRMGSDPEAVVDPELRVRGVAGLRVVDASVMPTTTSGNTNAATIMIGERAAELIRTGTAPVRADVLRKVSA